ncbi:uroporphyrinogen decarboxylase [Pelagibacteraceae bacterium GOM-A3]|jgi:uroporphyrinogen decarboxylase|nr:uroporphyrinogen decarboxylase [Pelagibacteraceae bacterium GOM-A3]
MSPITNCIKNQDTKTNPIWLMRQAGRYLPEFREIRKENQDFVKLCLNSDLASEITLQPIKRFDFDGAVIFSDILMLPYGLGQKVEFEKNFGPKLGELELEKIKNIDEINFTEKVYKVYKAISKTSKDPLMVNKDLIGFVGAPWTILVYMINKSSPKKGLSEFFFKDDFLINRLLSIIEKFLKLHIKNQVDAGAKVIQIFDSWAGLLNDKIPEYIYIPTLNIVDYVKQLGIPVICFPRGIKDYKNFCDIVKPDAVNIDYNVDPKSIVNEIKIPVQGGLDPKILLTDQDTLKREVEKYLNIFKDHPYIFNLGHGILPETKIEMVEDLIKIVRNFK